jgi:hypothetical protein
MDAVVCVPNQMQMTSGSGSGVLAPHPNLFVKQTKRGCLQELMGCEAKTEFQIATMDQKDFNLFYVLEQTSCMNRFVCGGNRPWEMIMSTGGAGGGPLVAKFVRPFKCPAGTCKICCHQEVQVKDANGSDLGLVKEQCYYFVPMFDIKRPDMSVEYRLGPPTCLGGTCVNVCAEGCCNCRIPFYVFPPTGGSDTGSKIGSMTKIWGGLGTELFTDADKFEVTFPNDATPDGKLRLLGSLFLLNQIFFEGQKGV